MNKLFYISLCLCTIGACQAKQYDSYTMMSTPYQETNRISINNKKENKIKTFANKVKNNFNEKVIKKINKD